MPHITGHDRSQLLILPESLDDYVSAENTVRFIEAFVDGLWPRLALRASRPKRPVTLTMRPPIC
jgi:hypothetical protein